VLLVQHVSKVFPLYRRPSDRIREILPFAGRSRHTDFWALRNVTFGVERGEVLSLIGPNGSGKSTLLQIVSGILQPTTGRVLKHGRVAALLELGAGFNPEFSGRDNVYLSGEIMGLSRSELSAAFPKIEQFADIGAFIDRPVKEYSSGMYVRLAFAAAIHVEPEILIVDEVLAVGDAIFANRCVQKFEELKRRGVTVLFVSHDLGLVKRLSDRAIFMLNGQVAAEGEPRDVVNRYVGFVLDRQSTEAAPESELETNWNLRPSFRHGDGASRITSVDLLNADGESLRAVTSGEPVRVRIVAEFSRRASHPVVGILIRNRLGIDVFGTNTRIEHVDLGDFEEGESLIIEFAFPCILSRQDYTLTAATQYPDGTSQDWLDDAIQFSVIEPKDIAGMLNLRPEIHWRKAGSQAAWIAGGLPTHGNQR
jgi:ABC-type polysaccharide/polyol phosphate transport system ATPase subunit